MYEVEVKVRAAHGPVRERLADLDAEPRGAVRQHDTYYDHPVRSFAETDEALRLRRETAEDGASAGSGDDGSAAGRDDRAATLTYKGPQVDDVSKTRREVETRVTDAAAMDGVLRAVGFEPAATVEKVRERFAVAGFDVALDSVGGLGEFVEVEAGADRENVEELRAGAFELVGRLGLDRDAAVRTSYLALLLATGDAATGPTDRPGDN